MNGFFFGFFQKKPEIARKITFFMHFTGGICNPEIDVLRSKQIDPLLVDHPTISEPVGADTTRDVY